MDVDQPANNEIPAETSQKAKSSTNVAQAAK